MHTHSKQVRSGARLSNALRVLARLARETRREQLTKRHIDKMHREMERASFREAFTSYAGQNGSDDTVARVREDDDMLLQRWEDEGGTWIA